jgi:NAD(P)H dehydrogenase (quinone)
MKILVVYYSAYGHVLALAEAVCAGIDSVQGAEAVLRQVEDFPESRAALASGEHGKLNLERQKDIPVATLDDLREAQGVVFGTPTRYGNMIAQMKRFIDSTLPLWLRGELEGKPAGVFTSTATTHGGQETTIIASMIPLFHLGMIMVGVPYSTPGMLHTEARGGTPYGPSTIAGSDNSHVPAPEDLSLARALGKRVAETTLKLRG